MAFPKLLQKLFQNSGAGSLLREDIIPVDSALSSSSTNAVQNKVVNTALSAKADATALDSYLPLSGGTMTGNIERITKTNLVYRIGNNYVGGLSIYPVYNNISYSVGTCINLYPNADSGLNAILLEAASCDTEFTKNVLRTRFWIFPNGQLTHQKQTFNDDGSSASVVSGQIHSLVASSYNSSTGAWYRKYSDGWIEQGGKITSSEGRTGNVDKTITLNVPMKDTNYYVLWRFITNWTDAYPYTGITKSTSSFVMHIAQGFFEVEWQVKGFAAS